MKKILIVDDEPHIRRLLEEMLEDFEDNGTLIYTASDGSEAMDMILKEKPDMVFLDVMMPGISGYDICKMIKKEHGLKDIYVMMLTAKGQEFDRNRGIEAGADMYVTKPFGPDFIIAKTSEILKINL